MAERILQRIEQLRQLETEEFLGIEDEVSQKLAAIHQRFADLRNELNSLAPMQF